MESFSANVGWLLVAYTTGSVFTGWIFYKSGIRNGIENTIDSLVDQGFLRHKKQAGEIEILKWNDSADQEG
jgi:hypothetical protein